MNKLSIWLRFKDGGKNIIINDLELNNNFSNKDLTKYILAEFKDENEDEIVDSIKNILLNSNMVCRHGDVVLSKHYNTTLQYDGFKITMIYNYIDGMVEFYNMIIHSDNGGILQKESGHINIFKTLTGIKSLKYNVGSVDRMLMKINDDKLKSGTPKWIKRDHI
ncbi:MAG: hypothetical protein ACRCXT_00905 [Paraclostridium sp.]